MTHKASAAAISASYVGSIVLGPTYVAPMISQARFRLSAPMPGMNVLLLWGFPACRDAGLPRSRKPASAARCAGVAPAPGWLCRVGQSCSNASLTFCSRGFMILHSRRRAQAPWLRAQAARHAEVRECALRARPHPLCLQRACLRAAHPLPAHLHRHQASVASSWCQWCQDGLLRDGSYATLNLRWEPRQATPTALATHHSRQEVVAQRKATWVRCIGSLHLLTDTGGRDGSPGPAHQSALCVL